MPPSTIRQAAGEELLLQGVVDCAFETPDGLVVVDFKTDRVTPQQQSQRAEELPSPAGGLRAGAG